MHIQFQLVQQCIQISTRINSSMYIPTSSFFSFETHPIFNNPYLGFCTTYSYLTLPPHGVRSHPQGPGPIHLTLTLTPSFPITWGNPTPRTNPNPWAHPPRLTLPRVWGTPNKGHSTTPTWGSASPIHT